MYIMHFIELWNSADQQIIEIRARDMAACITAYCKRNYGNDHIMQVITPTRFLCGNEWTLDALEVATPHLVYVHCNIAE